MRKFLRMEGKGEGRKEGRIAAQEIRSKVFRFIEVTEVKNTFGDSYFYCVVKTSLHNVPTS